MQLSRAFRRALYLLVLREPRRVAELRSRLHRYVRAWRGWHDEPLEAVRIRREVDGLLRGWLGEAFVGLSVDEAFHFHDLLGSSDEPPKSRVEAMSLN